MVWTIFWDMHSGGRQKLDWDKIYIEAPQEEAISIFYSKFGRNPNRVTCTCCGEDYSIREQDTLKIITAFHRGCIPLKVPKDPKTGLYKNNDPVVKAHPYLEKDEDPPPGYEADTKYYRSNEYITLEDYVKRNNVKVIYASDINDNERNGYVPEEGYVWY